MEPSPHVLVVDDHRDIRELLSRYLAQHGFRVSAAEDAAAARRILKSAAIDLVVLDVMMPGESGCVAKIISKRLVRGKQFEISSLEFCI